MDASHEAAGHDRAPGRASAALSPSELPIRLVSAETSSVVLRKV